MISLEEEKGKILLDTMPYLRPLYLKGILSMYKILSISWKESLINMQNKYQNLKSKNNNDENDNNELKEINNKMFYIFSFMNHFHQMIDKGKLKKYDGLDYIYNKLNNFLTFCRKIISYKILDIDFEEFNQTKIMLKLIVHVKLFLIFCEYDTYQTEREFIEDLILIFSPKENEFKLDEENILNTNEKDGNSIINSTQNEEDIIIKNLIKDIREENINLQSIYSFVKEKYELIYEKYKNFINENKFTFLTILYEDYFEIKTSEEDKENPKESSDEEEEDKINEDKKKKKKRKHKKKKNKKNENKNLSDFNEDKNTNKNLFEDNKEKPNNNNMNNINNISLNGINKQNEIIENKINESNNDNINNEKIESNKNGINNLNDNKNEKNEKDTKESINRKIATIKTIQSIAKMTNKIINNSAFAENDNSIDTINSDKTISLPKNKVDFDEIKIKFFEPLVPYIEQYKKIYGNKTMPILAILQCAFLVFEEKHRREKQKLLDEIKNLKKAMNQMFIQIQLMGGGRDIFRSTLYYLILIFIPEEQNISSFFLKIQKLINFFQKKVDADLLILKNLTPGVGSNFENTSQIIKRLHKNSQYVLFIKSLFFMYKYFNYIVHLNTNEKLQIKNDEDDNINNENEINSNSLITKLNTKNIKYNLPVLKNYNLFQEENSVSIFNNKKDMIFPTFNFNDCFSSYANFLDELVTNEKTQIILEQVIQKIEKENNQGDVPKFEIKDLFQEKDGKKIFNLTGFDVQVIIHDIKSMKYKEETIENLVNSKTWEKSQQES